MAFFDNLLTGGHLGPAERSEILSAAAAKENSTEQTLARAVALLLARPEAQLT
jgi:hypothetical protein